MTPAAQDGAEHLDVLIVGAGLSGVGAGCHLRRERPDKTFCILEARDAMGGTWDLFRYPGIRSDSDMFTLGYDFKPWKGAKSIADGESIREYIHETAGEHDVTEAIRFHHRVVRASWSTPEARWSVEAEHTDTGESVHFTCGFLFMCTGYYRYDEGFTPEFDGIERYAGQIVHPQHWPEDLEYAGKRVVVIGSGATAVTLIPSMADETEHITMLQRSPGYIVTLPARDPIADVLRKLLPDKLAYSLVRWKNVGVTVGFYEFCRRFPKVARKLIGFNLRRHLPRDLSLDPHFSPSYDPWDQRVCLVPDNDLFRAMKKGRASIVTDRIASFTEEGLALESGAELEADIIITATGLNLLALGGMGIEVDGREVKLSDTVGYKGMMLSGVPNLAVALGYTNASWTLKCDLTCAYVCRLLKHMDETGRPICTPRAPDPSMPLRPFIDLASNYVLRSVDSFPKQGDRAPWRLYQNYPRDIAMLRRGSLEDEGIEFSGGQADRDREPIAA